MSRSFALVSLLVALLAAACGQSGTLSFTLLFPPGVTRLPAEAVTVRLTLDDAAYELPFVYTAPVAADGSFALALEAPADGVTGYVTFEALDAAGAVVARATSGPLPIAAYEAQLALFVAGPRTFAAAPVSLPAPRAEVAVVPLPYGALLAGGADAEGAPVDALTIYNVNLHAFEEGAPLPAPRAGQAAAAGDYGLVYLFGGRDAAGAPVADAWSFDTNAPPMGVYDPLTADAAFARAGADAARLAPERFLVTGDPLLVLDGTSGAVTALADAPAEALAATTADATVVDSVRHVVLAGPGGGAIYDVASGTFRAITVTPRREHVAVVAADHAVLLLGGADPAGGALLTTAQRIDAVSGDVTTIPALARGRRRPAIALTSGQIVVAGGFDAAGAALDDAEILDATTLAPIAVVPLAVPRGGARAQALSNGNVLLVGGRASEGGAPIATLELYTP